MPGPASSSTPNSVAMSKILKGDLFCVINGVCFLLAAAVTRHATTASPDQFLFARIVAFFFIGLVSLLRNGDWRPLLVDPTFLFFASLNGFATVNMNFTYLLTLNHLATSDAYVINRLRVVVTGLLSSLLCGHPFGIFSLFCTLLILFGVVLVAEPSILFDSTSSTYNIPLVGYFIIASAVFFGGANSVFIQLAHQNSCFITSSQFVFLMGFIGVVQYCLSGYIPSNLDFLWHDYDKIFIHVVLSIGTLVSFKLSLDYISAQRFAVVSCILIPISYLIDILFLKSQLSFSSFLGALFVFVGVLLYTKSQQKPVKD